MTQQNSLSRVERINDRIDQAVAGSITVSRKNGLVVESMQQAMELAKLMSVSDKAVPKHLRGNPGACLAVSIQAFEWSINPFALANKSYDVSDRLSYESALYHAVVQRRAPIKGRIKCEYIGKDAQRQCRIWAILEDGQDTVEYTSPETGKIKPKNSPLWVNDPDQQLFYFSVRAFARRHFPDVMMGIYTVDELIDAPAFENGSNVSKPAEEKSRTQLLEERLTSRPVSENQTFEPNGDAIDTTTGEVIEAQEPTPDKATPNTPDAEPPIVTELNEAAIALGLAPSAPGAFWNEYSVKKGLKGAEAILIPAQVNAAVDAFAVWAKKQGEK